MSAAHGDVLWPQFRVFQDTVESKLVGLKKMERWVKKLEDQVNLLWLDSQGLQMWCASVSVLVESTLANH